MRAPRSRVPASRRRGSVARNPELFSTREKYYVVLIIMLVSATVTCFGTAYYLFTTRWDSPVHNPVLTWHSDKAVQVVPYDLDDELRAFAASPQDRFLAYLPHSGFHNQRIAFEMLSCYLVYLIAPCLYLPSVSEKNLCAMSNLMHCVNISYSPERKACNTVRMFLYISPCRMNVSIIWTILIFHGNGLSTSLNQGQSAATPGLELHGTVDI